MNQYQSDITENISNALTSVEKTAYDLGYSIAKSKYNDNAFNRGVRLAVEILLASDGIFDTASHDKMYASVQEQITIINMGKEGV